jgi:hypothetical protein
MDANYSAYGQPPTQKESTQPSKSQLDTRIHIASDDIGGKKGSNRNWLYGGEDKDELGWQA